MSEVTTLGSAPAGNPGGGSESTSLAPGSGGDAGAGGQAQGAGGQAESWSSGLQDEGNRSLVATKGWDGPDAALKAYRDLETYQGSSISMPGEGATDDDWRTFNTKLGVPEKAEDYKIEVAEGGDTKAADELKVVMHEAKLMPHQAQAVYDQLMTMYDGGKQAAAEAAALAQTEALRAATADLTTAWGQPQGEAFKKNAEMARRTIQELGGDALFKELRALGVLTGTDEVANAPIVKMLAEVGTQLFGEGSFTEGGSASTVNPFKADELNLTEQGRLVSKDPARARAMILAAGKKPGDYGLTT